MKYEIGKNCHLFHSLVGTYPREFLKLMNRHERDPHPEKFMAFLNGGKSVGELEKSLGLDIREVMCCASKQNPALTYHKPFGLILSGEIKVIFDNDSGVTMSEDGTYPSEAYYNSAHKVDLQTIMTTWYDRFLKSHDFILNEAILKRNSRIIGAFHDPSFDGERLKWSYDCTLKDKEYQRFIERVKQLNMNLVEVTAKFK